MSETYKIDQNQVKLSMIDNRLTIEIEAFPSGRSFSIELDNDAIAQASNEIFADADAMYNGLVEALKKAYKEVSLAFDDNGKLSYKLAFSVGSIRKEHQFRLSLQEKKLSQISLVENKLESLQKFVENIERKNQERLEKMNERISAENTKIIEMMNRLETIICEKLGAFEKRIAALENKKEEKELPQNFNPRLLESRGFIFSNNNKTIQWKGEGRFELPILESLPQKGRVRISVKVEKVMFAICLGLAPVNQSFAQSWYEYEIRFFTNDERIEKANTGLVIARRRTDYTFKIGDIVSMIVDIDSERVSFEVNQREVNYVQLDLKKKAYFPYCGFDNAGDKITFVSAQLEK